MSKNYSNNFIYLQLNLIPTHEDGTKSLKIEVHIIGQNCLWRKKDLEVQILGFIREERKFSHPSDLVSQIQEDIAQAQRFFSASSCEEIKAKRQRNEPSHI